MTNLFLKKNVGAATLLTTFVLLILATLIIFFAANMGIIQTKISANVARQKSAFNAAQAGLEFGINYLQQNSDTIVASPVGGYIPNFSNSSTTNVSLADGSRYSIVYTNPIANNYTLIKITSTGTSADGSTTKTISQLVQRGSLLASGGNFALVSKGAINLTGSGTITNTITNQTVKSASTVTLGGSSETVTSSGGSTPGHIGSDITANDATLAATSVNDFFATYLGNASTSTVKSQVAHYYNNTSSTNYSSTLNGMTGTSIWIDQAPGTTATINGNTNIGSTTNPVLMVINGDLSLSGTINFYGFIFVLGTSGITALTGNINIVGAIVSTDNLNMTGSTELTFNTTVLNNLQNQVSMRYFAKVPGSWKDF